MVEVPQVTEFGVPITPPKEEFPQVTDEKSYEAVPFGSKYKSGEQILTKSHKVTSDEEYEVVPEGEQYVGPDNVPRIKQKSEGLDYTTQTLYNMAVNDKERRRALEFGYKGKVKEDALKRLYVEDEDGVKRRPKGITESPGAALTGMAAPVVGSVLGTVGAGLPGAFGGAVLGQSINDAVLALAGVYDRDITEQASATGLAGMTSLAGAGVGRGIAAVAPAAKGIAKTSLPTMAAAFLGAEKEGLQTAIPLAEKGVLTPVSGWAKESPHLINIQEVFDPAFRTQKPLLESATGHYEQTAGELLEGMGVKTEGKLTDPKAAVSTKEAGEAVLNKARAELQASDAKMNALLAEKQVAVKTRVGETAVTAETNKKALESAAVENRKAAEKVIQAGFNDIQNDINAAMQSVKAGHNSGDLWWAVGEKLKAVKQGIQTRAKIMYDGADRLAGTHLPNIEGLADQATAFLAQLPEGFENKFPSIVKQLRDIAGVPELDAAGQPTGNWLKEPVHPTFGQLHNLRSHMRANYNFFDLTPDVKDGTFKFFANKVDGILNDTNAVPELRAASKALREADDFYRDNIGPLTDKNIQAVVSGLESGMPADPKNLFNTLVKEGRSELTNKVRELVGSNLWAGVKAADIQEMLDLSKTLTPDVIDGRAFVRQVLDRHRNNMLEAVHGKEASAKLIKQAQYVQMMDGKLDIPVRPGDTVTEIISKARQAAEAAKTAANKDPLSLLNKEMKAMQAEHNKAVALAARQRSKEPLGFLYDPKMGAVEAADKILGSEDLIIAAASKFGENSPEFTMLRQTWAKRLLTNTLTPSEKLAKVSPEIQELMFPGIKLEHMQKLAKEMDFLMSTRGVKETAKSMAAQAKVEHPWSSMIIKGPIGVGLPGVDAVGRAMLSKYYKTVTNFISHPAVLKWIMKGLDGDPSARKQALEALRQAFTAKSAKRATEMGSAVGAAVGESQLQTSEPESRQEGGPVTAGKPYVVGEQGPEIIVPQQGGTVVSNSQFSLSDITPEPVSAFQQYAANTPKRAIPESALEGGPIAISGGGGPGKAQIIPPRSVSTEKASLQAQYRELEEQQRTLMQLRPMVPTLIKLGVTPQQMLKMNPTEAYQFIKARTPQGGWGKVNREDDKVVSDMIDNLRQQRGLIGDRLIGGE